MYTNAFKDPRKFYKKYKREPRMTAPFTLQQCQEHFVNLLQGDASTKYVHGSVEEHCQTHEALFGTPTHEKLESASVLNDIVSADEVVRALKTMQAGKAAGPDGVPNEVFASAYWEEFFVNSEGRLVPKRHYIFGETLARMFTKVLRTGVYPESWAVAALVPVPKPKSSGSSIDDYRGIAVGNAIGKIYAKVIMDRMDTWAERQGHRAVSQFGFRGEVGTLEAAFVLRHMVETSVAAQGPLYTAFIDFRKAYDRVDRELLWRMLHKLGVHGDCLRTLRSMYETVLLQVRLNGEMGEPFLSHVGVKQGDPLSPLLFGLFIDRFQDFLDSKLRQAGHTENMGVKVGDLFIKMLLYADDMVLAAKDSRILQVQLDILAEFCAIVGMEVNISKSECVIFNKDAHRRRAGSSVGWSYEGHDLDVKECFIYLGVRMGSEGAAKADRLAAKRMVNKGRAALITMMGTCQSNGLYNPFLQRHLYHTLVAPVLSYGSEIWGPSYVGSMWARGAYKGEQEDVLKLFIRMCFWTPKSTPLAPTMMELNCVPVLVQFLKRILVFWNRLVRADVASLQAAAFQGSIALHDNGCKSWAQGFATMLLGFGYSETEVFDMMHCGEVLSTEDICNKAVHAWMAHVADSHSFGVDRTNRVVDDTPAVREVPDNVHHGFKHIKYHRWFRNPHESDGVMKYKDSCCLNALFSVAHVRTIFNFRLGMSGLNCESMRNTHPARSTRHCARCNLCDIEDEVHVLICPSYTDLRSRFQDVFGTHAYIKLKVCFDSGCYGSELDKAMAQFMNVQDVPFWRCFAEYLMCVKSRRLGA
jgi:hypothetical protein